MKVKDILNLVESDVSIIDDDLGMKIVFIRFNYMKEINYILCESILEKEIKSLCSKENELQIGIEIERDDSDYYG